MWLYVLIAVGSLPVLTTVIGVPWVFYAEWRRNRRIAAGWAEAERVLSDRWLADQAEPYSEWFVGDLGQSSNPRARP